MSTIEQSVWIESRGAETGGWRGEVKRPDEA
jgi:hypothetical protein